MKVSIVTISFNQARFLEAAIRSVVEQDYPDIEYILVDPGSTDGSRDIIEKYRDRIAHVILDPDEGPADGLNKGFRLATGEIYGFLNSDDILLSGAVSSAVDFFKKHPEVDVVSGDALIIDKDGKELRKSYSDRFSLKRFAYGACVLLQPSTFFRKDAFWEVGGFNRQNRRAWDGELWVDMALKGKRFALSREFWSGFRLHDTGITATGGDEDPIRTFHDEMFRRIMGREKRMADRWMAYWFRIIRHILNPKDTIERVLHGPIYGRYKN